MKQAGTHYSHNSLAYTHIFFESGNNEHQKLQFQVQETTNILIHILKNCSLTNFNM